MDVKEKILQLMKIKGPVLPVQVSKEINSDILMASAHLSELSSQQKVKISSLKVGGSPLYYLAGQEASLEKFSDNLHEKEKKAYVAIKQKQVLRDNGLEPVLRVALRGIKDFAIPLQVNYNDNKEIFWKWHSLPNNEAEIIIKSMLNIEPEKKPAEQKIQEKEKIEKIPEIKKAVKEEVKKQLKEEVKKQPKEDAFMEEIVAFFNKNKINLLNKNIIKKNSEIDFLIELPSAVGVLQYYCKAKSKTRISDADLSSAYLQGQLKKLPVLFLTTGDLTKKAKEMLDNEFQGITVKKI